MTDIKNKEQLNMREVFEANATSSEEKKFFVKMLGEAQDIFIPEDRDESLKFLEEIAKILETSGIDNVFSKSLLLSSSEFISSVGDSYFPDKHLDSQLHSSVLNRFRVISEERIDKDLLVITNKSYTAKWTTRVAAYWFCERFYSFAYEQTNGKVDDDLKYFNSILCKGLNEKALIKMNRNLRNPFNMWEHALIPVMEAWRPLMKKICISYAKRTLGGFSILEDMESVASMAFLYSLEQHFRHLVGKPKLSQSLPFPQRLQRALQKMIAIEIAHNTGPVKVPAESQARKEGNLPTAVSYEDIYDYKKK